MASSPSGRIDQGALLNLSIWTLAAGSTGFLALRVWAKLRRDRKLWWDDHFLTAAWATLILGCILQSYDVKLGFGKNFAEIDPALVPTTRLVSVIAGFFLILTACWSKTSFALTLLRISEGWPRRWVLFVIWSTNIVITLSGVVQWAQCWPLKKLWEQDLDGTCLPLEFINGYNMFAAGYSGLMDVTLALLPWWIIFRSSNSFTALETQLSRLEKREKIGISIAMSMAIFAGATSFLKIYAIIRVNMPNAKPEHIIALMILGTAEGAITIMAVSIPVLGTLDRREEKEVGV